MASIKGIQLKSIKEFMGREGYAFTANIYLNNKKVGEIVDHADGSGEFKIYIQKDEVKNELAKLIKEYYKENPKYYLYYNENTEERYQWEGLVSEIAEELLELDFIEKTFKKNVKKGYPITVALNYNERIKDIMDDDYNHENTTAVGVKVWDERMEKEISKKYKNVKVFKAYEKLEDFIIK